MKIGIASICCALALTVQVRTAYAANAPDIDPEVMATSWEEQGDRFASLTLNGREIIKFKETGENHNGESLVEDMAAKLDELVKDNRFQPEKILPAKDGDMVAIRVNGNTVIRFPAPNVVDAQKGTALSPLETSLKLANAIRSSFGASILPQGFLKVVEIAQDGGVGNGVDHFSGSASWYGGKFNGHKTSDGTKYDQEGLTAAHRSLPFGTKLLVMNRKTGHSCVVKVNDRGPFVDGRVIDLSKGAAKELNMLGSGVALVDCLVLELP